jgi:hypothetical protein
LYYGYQQATNKGLAAQKKYILANNYPGMYANASSCLSNLKSPNAQLSPNLNTVAKDSNWKIPKGTRLNKLANKKPAGETFILDVKKSGSTTLNHVTIYKGKAYFFFWVCDQQGTGVSAEVLANRKYLAAAADIASEEEDLVARWASVSGANYSSDYVMYRELKTLIPDTQNFIDKLYGIETPTSTLETVNGYLISAWECYISSFTYYHDAIATQNASLISSGNKQQTLGRSWLAKFKSAGAALKR